MFDALHQIAIVSHLRKSHDGFSLLEALLGVFLLSVMVSLVATTNKASKNSESLAALKLEKTVIKKYLKDEVSCARTIKSNNGRCKPGEILQLFSHENKSILNATGAPTKIGKYSVRAECSPTGVGIMFRATLTTKHAGIRSSAPRFFVKEPLTGKKYSWASPKSILMDSSKSENPSVKEPFTLCEQSFQEVNIGGARNFKVCALTGTSMSSFNALGSFNCGVSKDAKGNFKLEKNNSLVPDKFPGNCTMYCIN